MVRGPSGLVLHFEGPGQESGAEKNQPLDQKLFHWILPLCGTITFQPNTIFRSQSACSGQNRSKTIFASRLQPPTPADQRQQGRSADAQESCSSGKHSAQLQLLHTLNQWLAAATHDEKMFCIRNRKYNRRKDIGGSDPLFKRQVSSPLLRA